LVEQARAHAASSPSPTSSAPTTTPDGPATTEDRYEQAAARARAEGRTPRGFGRRRPRW
jgi:hypothetical protein